MEEIRSFIAIELPDDLKRALRRLQGKLEPATGSSVKWVDPSGIHLTLKFLGNIAASRVSEIVGAMEAAAEGISPFQLESLGTGAFPNLKRVQVVWVGVGGEIDKLAQLQQRLEERLARLGFPRESRPFTAHLTLGRVRDRASFEERQSFGDVIAKTSFETKYVIQANRIKLMKSQLTREGAIYSVVDSVELKNP